jgi:hypothetical protein
MPWTTWPAPLPLLRAEHWALYRMWERTNFTQNPYPGAISEWPLEWWMDVERIEYALARARHEQREAIAPTAFGGMPEDERAIHLAALADSRRALNDYMSQALRGGR